MSIFFTIIVIGVLILSGPAQAIDVFLITSDIDVSTDAEKELTIEVKIHDGEFLPVLYTDIVFDGGNAFTCRINQDNSVTGCSFLTLDSVEYADLIAGYGYGYGYGYDSFGLGYHSFGYGYGYSTVTLSPEGTGGLSQSPNPGSEDPLEYGTITYHLKIDSSRLPGSFMGERISVEAKVYGGNEDNRNYFRGTSSFEITSSPVEFTVAPTLVSEINYNDILLEIPAGALPSDATTITIQQVAPTASPLTSTLRILGKTYNFDINSATNTFSQPIRITLTYTDDELIEAGITDETDIIPAYYDTTTGDWVSLPVLLRDPANNEITFLTTHFTQFTLLGDTSTPPAPSPSGDGGTSSGGGGESRGGGAIISSRPPAEPTELPAEEEPITPVTTPTTTLPTSATPSEETAPTGFAAITGAIVGVLGATGSVVALVLVIAAIGTGSYFYFKRKKKE